MTLRQIGAVVVCAFALSISAAEATQRQKKPRIASQALIYCALDQTYRHSCPGTVEPTQRRARRAGRASISLAGLPAPLVAKVREIEAACGSIVVSAYRPGARIPTGQISNHARHKAADVRGNPRCIYAHLHGWPGGYSTDYARAPGGPHVHISYNPNGMEWGARFVHHGRSRHAKRRHHHVAGL